MAGLSRAAGAVVDALRETAEMIVVKHTVFALPFALVALVSATGEAWPSARVWLWTVVAMVAARTAAMTFNRLADQTVDAANPRTAGRALPAGRLGRPFAWAVTIAASLLFVVAAAMLNRLCLILAPPTLAVLVGYSWSKRFTSLTHLWLGLALGLAPVGAWIAGGGGLALQPVVLGLAVAGWVAGFDIIYSLQDEAFDRAHCLRSLPATVGARRALAISRILHIGALVGFASFAAMLGGGGARWAAVAAAGALLAYQHSIVAPDDLAAVDAAFFTANGVLALVMGALFVFAKIRLH